MRMEKKILTMEQFAAAPRGVIIPRGGEAERFWQDVVDFMQLKNIKYNYDKEQFEANDVTPHTP